MVKTLPANVGETRDLGSIPGLGRSLEQEMVIYSSTFDWEIPWTEEPGGLPSMGLRRVGHDRVPPPPPWQGMRVPTVSYGLL